MTIQEILKLPRTSLKPYGIELADAYWQIFQLKVCLSCTGDVAEMLYKLKKHFEMTQFELKKPNVIYRISKGTPYTISNDVMSDELAIEFLRGNAERIALFSKYPDNWVELVKVEAPRESDTDDKTPMDINIDPINTDEDCGCDGTTEQGHEPDCRDCLFKKLTPISVFTIEEMYPEVPYTHGLKKADYIGQIADHLKLV